MHLDHRLRRSSIIAALATLLGGCIPPATVGPDDPEPTPEETPDPGPEVCALEGGDPAFDFDHLVWQGYWYSRYNLGSLTMRSGNGVVAMPPPDAVQLMVAAASDSTSSAMPPQNVALLSRVFDVGQPQMIVPDDGDPMDLADGRWSAISPEQAASTDPAAFGWTLVKIVEWMKQFHVDAHFGVPGGDDDIPGAQQRFAGFALFVEGLMMAEAWAEQPDAFGVGEAGARYVALMALSDLAGVLNAEALPHSVSNRYVVLAAALLPHLGRELPEYREQLAASIEELLAELEPAADARGAAIAVQSLAWYLALGDDAASSSVALELLAANAEVLLQEDPTNAAGLGQRIRGSVEAWRVTGDERYLDAAADAYFELEQSYDCARGVFTSQDEYSTDDVAAIAAGLNAARLFVAEERRDLDLDRPQAVLVGFWEGLVDIGGLQLSAPPPSPPSIPEYEYQGDDLYHRHEDLLTPGEAGGEFGTAPVFGSNAIWDAEDGSWTVDAAFDTAGAMHLANEVLWLHFDYVSGFPEVE